MNIPALLAALHQAQTQIPTMRSVQSTGLIIGNLGKGALLILQAQTQILMMRSVLSTGLIIGSLRKSAQAPVQTLMMSTISVQSTVLIIRGQRNGAEQHFCDCCRRISAMMVKPTGWHSSRSSLGMPLHANGLLRNV